MYAAFPPIPRILARRQTGFTLTEMAVVIGIFGLVLGAIWSAVGQVNERNNAQKATVEAMQIVNGYGSLYAKNGVDVPFGTDITCIGVNAKYFPLGMTNPATPCITGDPTGASDPVTPWGHGTDLVVFAQPPNAILLSYQGLSKSACVAIATNLSFLQQAVYENFNGTPNGNAVTGVYTPFPMSTIINDCYTSDNQLQIGLRVR